MSQNDQRPSTKEQPTQNTPSTPDVPWQSLQQDIQTANRLLHRQVSLLHLMLRSLLGGVGYALGATLVFGVVIALLVRFLELTEHIAFIQDFAGRLEILDALEDLDNAQQ